jgi:hypothetical protein
MWVPAAAAVAPDVENAAFLAEGFVATVAVYHGRIPAADFTDFTFCESYLVHECINSRASEETRLKLISYFSSGPTQGACSPDSIKGIGLMVPPLAAMAPMPR